MAAQYSDHHHIIKTFMAFLILVIAFSMLLVFVNNSENIIEGQNFKLFMTLAIVGAGLLVGLLYLVSNSDTRGVTVAKSSSKSKAKSKKKKK